MESRRRPFLLSLPFFLWSAFFLAAPLVLIVVTSFSRRSELGMIEAVFDASAYDQLFDPLYAHVLLRTLAFAVANTVATTAIAYPIAFYLSRLAPRQRHWALTFVLIPFWTNFLVRVLAFMDVLRTNPFGFEWLYTSHGVLAALVYNYLPFAILPLFSTMCGIESSLLEAAQDLGAKKRQIFLEILWPLTKSGTRAAALLVFIPSLGEFLIPDLVGGGRFFVLGTFLQNQFLSARNWPLGSAAIVLLAGITLAVLGLVNSAKGDKTPEARRV